MHACEWSHRKARFTTAIALVAGACAVIAARDAWADVPEHVTASLTVTNASANASLASCPDRTVLAGAVATRLGYDPFAEEAAAEGSTASRAVAVRFRRDGGKSVVAELEVAGEGRVPASQRRLVSEAGSCEEVGAAAAFAVATLLDPRAMFPKPRSAAPPPPEGGVPSAGPSLDTRSPGTWPWYEPPPLPPPRTEPIAPASAVRGHVGALALGCVGCAPAPNPGASIFGGIAKGHVGLDVGIRGDLPVSAAAESGRVARASLVVGEIAPHARFGIFRPGLVGVAGALFGDSDGERQTSFWSAAGARVAIEVPVGDTFFVRAAADGLFVLGRVSLRVDGRELWASPSVVASLGAGIGVRL